MLFRIVILTVLIAGCGDSGTVGGDTSTTADTLEDTSGADTSTGPDVDDDTKAPEDTGSPDTKVGGPNCPPFSGERPPALSEHAGVYDPIGKRLVFHGGNPEFPVQCIGKNSYVSETWSYLLECQQWEKLASDGPSARGRSSAVYDSNNHAMVIFGGRFRTKGASGLSPYTLYDETWRFDLVTDTWTQMVTSGQGPSARVSASAIFDPTQNRLVLFGGNSSSGGVNYIPHNDTYALDLATATWTQLQTAGAPSPRLFAAPAYDSKRHAMIIVHGGDQNAFIGPFLGDTWSLDLASLQWTQIDAGTPSQSPDRRIWGRAVYSSAKDRIVLFGGHDDGTLGNRNDLWELNPETGSWEMMQQGDTFNKPSNGICDFPPDFANVVFGIPERRGAHLFAYSEAENKIFVHGGKTDCGEIDDVWELDLATYSWLDVEPATIGEVCIRYSDTCTSICN
jgi:hypothetical protein